MSPTDKAPETKEWTVPKEALLPDDPLANCLAILTRIQHQPHSAQSLTAGLPLEESRLTPELFIRAAARANLSARIIKRSLAEISNLTLPAVLLLQDGDACILLEREEGGQLRIIQPESGDGEIKLDPEERRIATLTGREKEIVCVMSAHASTPAKAIAGMLRISEHTLRNHLTSIYGKLGVVSRLELFDYAHKRGLDRATPNALMSEADG